MKYEILKQTKKAKLLKIDNVEFWIQNRWIGKNGELTPSGFKSYEKSKKHFEMMKGYKLWVSKTPNEKNSEFYGRLYAQDNTYISFRIEYIKVRHRDFRQPFNVKEAYIYASDIPAETINEACDVLLYALK